MTTVTATTTAPVTKPIPPFVVKSIDDIGGALTSIQEATVEALGGLSARLMDAEQKLARRPGPSGGGADSGEKSLGQIVEEAFSENKELFGKTKNISFSVERKDITSPAVGAHGSQAVPTTPGPSGALLFDLVSPGDLAGLSVLHYPRRIGIVGAAGVQMAEGAPKSNAEPAFAGISQNACTIAGFCVTSEQALGTAGALQRAINSHLARSIRLASDAVLVGGTLASAWPFEGFAALAAPFAGPVGFTSLADACLAGALHMRLGGFAPTVCVVNETAFLAMQLAKSSTGEYLLGNYLADLSFALGGMRVALSEGVPVGKAMLCDLGFCGFLSSGATRISMGYVGSQFTQNQVTVRAELEMLPFASDYEALMMVTPSAT